MIGVMWNWVKSGMMIFVVFRIISVLERIVEDNLFVVIV